MIEETISEEMIVNIHYKTPHSFVTYLDGRDGEVRVLIDMGHEVKIDEDGTLVATKGWRYFPGVKYTIKIDRDGNGVAESVTYTDEDWTFEDVEICTWYKHGDLIEAMRCLCYYFDDKIKLIPKKEASQ